MEQDELVKRILYLREKKNAVILVHNYQRPEIYEVADFIGDSLYLAQAAAKTDKDIIVFCGVDFMAESAKILNPEKLVLHPERAAKCPMAAMVDLKRLRRLKREHPKAAVVSYINTNAGTKALSDIICTSMNAVKIVNNLPNKEIIFVPDYNMAKYVETKTKKKIIPWPGYCYVHDFILLEEVKLLKKANPKALVVSHPECPLDVIKFSDHVSGTGGMIEYAKKSRAKKFIIATEQGMVNRLYREVPGKKFYPAAGICHNMKMITLSSVLKALNGEKYEVKVPQKIASKARKALDRMLNMG